MIEDIILTNDGCMSEEGYQDMLMRQKLAHGRLEADIYTLAIAKSKASVKPVPVSQPEFWAISSLN